MSKKTTILTLSLVSVIILAVLAFWFFSSRGGDTSGNDFFPFGLPSSDERNPGFFDKKGNGNILNDEATRVDTILERIWDKATAGAVPITKKTGGENIFVVRLIERATGHVYDIDMETNESVRVSNTTIPKVYEVLWGKNGKTFIARFLADDNSTIKTFSAEIVPGEDPDKEGVTEGSFLEDGIKDIVLSPDDEELFYFSDTPNAAAGIISDRNGDNARAIPLPPTEWLYQWKTKKAIYITTKPSFAAEGFSYALNTQSGSLQKVLGGIPGLTVNINKSGTAMLYSQSTGAGFILSFYDIKEGRVVPLSLTTLPEKCVWADNDEVLYCGVPARIESAQYPDNWYQGIISFSDDIWKLDTKTGAAELLVSPRELVGEELDIVKPALDSSGNYLVFINKKDLTVWKLKL